MPRRKSNKKAYYVTYAITREYLYRVKAESLKDAEQIAFEEGVFIRTLETTNVQTINVDLARAERARLVACTEAPCANIQ